MRYFGWLFCLVLFCTLLCFLLVSFMSCSSEGKPRKHPSANQFLLHTFLWTGMLYFLLKVLLCCVSLIDFATRQLFKPLSNGLYTQLTAFSSYQSSIVLSQRHFIFSLCLLFFFFASRMSSLFPQVLFECVKYTNEIFSNTFLQINKFFFSRFIFFPRKILISLMNRL